MSLRNLTKHNTKAVEALLEKTLKKIFALVDLHYHEWETDIVAFEKVKELMETVSPKSLRLIKILSKEYDSIFDIAVSLKVRDDINPNFILFKNLFERTI